MQVKIKKKEKYVGRIKTGAVFELEGKFFIATEEFELEAEKRRCIDLISGCNHWVDAKIKVLEQRAKLKIKE